MSRRWVRQAWLVSVVLCFSACTSAPTDLDDPLAYLLDRSRDPAKRLAVAERLGPIAQTQDPQATFNTLDRILWSDAQPTGLRLLAMDRLIAYDAETFWHIASINILIVDDWAVLEPLIERAVRRGEASFTTALVRSFARESRVLSDDKRPERAAILTLNPGGTVEQTVWQLLVCDDDKAGLAARVDAWKLINRIAGPGVSRELLRNESSSSQIVLDLQSAKWLDQLPNNKEGVLWLMRVREGHPDYLEEAEAFVSGLSDRQRDGIAIRHVGALLRGGEIYIDLEKPQLVHRVGQRLSGADTTPRSVAGNLRQLSDESLDAHVSDLCWADLVTIDMLLEMMADGRLTAELFRQADADLADTHTEHGGVLDRVDGRYVAIPFMPVIRAHDQKFYSSHALIERLYTGLLHYHFHAQNYANAEYAGPGGGDLVFVENVPASAVVFTFLDEDTLGVDYYHPGGVVVDLGVIKR